jgi:8-oxo-dGTP pyrophosphatase MutT (NUDIX family)
MPIRVVASVIEREGRLLVCERPAHKRHGGLWEFPGGKVEPGESDLDAVRRELREELDVDVVDIAPAEFSILDPGSPFLIAFLPVTIRGVPRCLEHSALAWLAEEELLALPLAPSDRRYLEWRVGVGAIAEHKFTTK